MRRPVQARLGAARQAFLERPDRGPLVAEADRVLAALDALGELVELRFLGMDARELAPLEERLAGPGGR